MGWMTMSDFVLSEKEHGCYGCEEYFKEDVKEFIRILKEEIGDAGDIWWEANCEVIDKLAGSELIK